MKNIHFFTLLIVVILILLWLFFWFQLRPTIIKQDCDKSSKKSYLELYKDFEKVYDKYDRGDISSSSMDRLEKFKEDTYKDCLRSEGI